MSKVLACIDASPYAASVCDLAAWVATRFAWGVQLLHVVQRKSAVAARHDLSGAIGLGVKSELLEELTRIEETQGRLAIETGKGLLATAESRLRAEGVCNVESVHLHGGIIETIIERETGADLVIMGKRGASSGYAAGHLGSKIERVLRASNKPLMAAPLEFSAIKEVVIAYDGGKSIGKALALAGNLHLLDGLPVHLVMAGSDSPDNREALRKAREAMAKGGRNVGSSLVPDAPDAAISRFMADRPESLLVMGAYGHSPLRNLIVGSTTTAMIRAIQAPVLLVR